MLKVEIKAFEKVIIRIVNSTDIRELIGEFSKDAVFFCSLLKDISKGKDSPNYHVLKKVARDRKISEQFIIEQAKSILSLFAPDEPKEDYYKILNISRLASADEIRSSWLDLMKTYHPDKIGDQGLDVTKKLNEAYEVLGNPIKRREYNARRLPALPVVVSGLWMDIGSKKLIYSASLTILIFGVIFYLMGSGLLFHSKEKGDLAEKIENKKEHIELPPPAAVKGPTSNKLKGGGREIFTSQQEEIKKNKYIEGNSLWEIAEGLNTSEDLEFANKLKSNKFDIWDILAIPQAKPKGVMEKEVQVAKVKGEVFTSERVKAQEEPSHPEVVLKGVSSQASVQSQIERKTKVAKKSKESKKEIKREVVAIKEKPKPNVSDQELEPPVYNKTSLYSFISEYVSAYKRRDINLFISFFEPDARENGMEVSKTIPSYRKNFSSLEIMEYDIQIKKIDFKDDGASINGDFVVFFRNKDDQKIKSSDGTISWVLLWQDNKWRIKELNYRVRE
jgi:curved DNA-binding protein CbpA